MVTRKMDLSRETSESLRARRQDSETYLKKLNSLGLGTYEIANEYRFPEEIEVIPSGTDPDAVERVNLDTIYVADGEIFKDWTDRLAKQFEVARKNDPNALKNYVQRVKKPDAEKASA